MISTLGVDAVVNLRVITVSTICNMSGVIRGVYSLREDFGEVIEAEPWKPHRLSGVHCEGEVAVWRHHWAF